MPNQPKTPNVVFRCPPELKAAAERVARDRGETLTAVIIRALEAYVRDWPGAS